MTLGLWKSDSESMPLGGMTFAYSKPSIALKMCSCQLLFKVKYRVIDSTEFNYMLRLAPYFQRMWGDSDSDSNDDYAQRFSRMQQC